VPFFRRASDDDREGRERAETERAASSAALAAGGLPLGAARRIEGLAAGGLFTSDLSVDEFALLHQIGARPLAQVMGSSIYHVGWQQNPGAWGGMGFGGRSQELTALSQAWNDARVRAFGRLEEEARLLGADAVVGVELTTGRHDWAAGAIEYIVVGTAVKLDSAQPSGAPVLTDLSGQDYWQLVQAGCRPLGVVGASTVYYIVSGWQQQRAQSLLYSSWANQELPDFTQGVYDARETALGRVTTAAQKHGADGVVGVSIEHSVDEREIDQGGRRRTDLIVTMHVLGTAVSVSATAATDLAPRLAIDLSQNRDQVHILGGDR
jgi:uncharacterized protein YbjQ (UPF0145 family)